MNRLRLCISSNSPFAACIGLALVTATALVLPATGSIFGGPASYAEAETTEFGAALLKQSQMRWVGEADAQFTVVATPSLATPLMQQVRPVPRIRPPVEVTTGGSTFCPAVPTFCPFDTTVCPKIPTICPVEETECAITVCPEIPTLCPAKETECPVSATVCPEIPTACPVEETECEFTVCPEIPTACPVEETECEFTVCPKVETLCPVESECSLEEVRPCYIITSPQIAMSAPRLLTPERVGDRSLAQVTTPTPRPIGMIFLPSTDWN